MAQRGIREYEGKKILFDGLAKTIPSFKGKSEKLALVTPATDPKKLVKDHPWLLKEKLVAKPDQLFGKRGKHGLLCLNKDFKAAWAWIAERMNKTVTVGKTTGELNVFMIEPFTPHSEDAEECYVAIRAYRDYDTVYLSNNGPSDFVAQYPTLRRRNGTAAVGSGPQTAETTFYLNSTYEATISLIHATHGTPNIRMKRAVFLLQQADRHFFTYYSYANSFQDRLTIRVDQPDYTNMDGALGFFGSMTIDTLAFPLSSVLRPR